MLSFILNACVKTVNYMGVNVGLNSALYSTSLLDLLHFQKRMGIKTQLFQSNLPINYTHFYTPNNNKFNLLNLNFTHNPQGLLITLKRKKEER